MQVRLRSSLTGRLLVSSLINMRQLTVICAVSWMRGFRSSRSCLRCPRQLLQVTESSQGKETGVSCHPPSGKQVLQLDTRHTPAPVSAPPSVHCRSNRLLFSFKEQPCSLPRTPDVESTSRCQQTQQSVTTRLRFSSSGTPAAHLTTSAGQLRRIVLAHEFSMSALRQTLSSLW